MIDHVSLKTSNQNASRRAFAYDPHGNNVEAVFHDPSEMKKP